MTPFLHFRDPSTGAVVWRCLWFCRRDFLT